MKYIFCFLLLIASPAFAQHDIFKAPERGIVSWLPVTDWNHALISGNGTMGAMVFGNPHDETIILNHAKLYLPQKRSVKPIDQASRLEEIRSLILQGKYTEATKIPVAIREAEGYTDARDPFIPAFDVNIQQAPANVKRYNRTVNFETGEAAVNWEDDNGLFQRTVFVSRADSVVVVRIKGSARINGILQFKRRPVEWTQWKFVSEGMEQMKASATEGWLNYTSDFKVRNEGSIVGYEGVGRVIAPGGNIVTENGVVKIENANEVLLLIDIRVRRSDTRQTDSMRKRVSNISFGYDELLQRHKAIHGSLFSKVRLNLGGKSEDHALSTETILLKSKKEVPIALIEKTFDAGRYAIISSTGVNPPNLQGLWTGTWLAPWTGGFTHDGNLATAISVLLPGNMPSLIDAFFRYHENLLEEYRTSAKTLFNCRGIHIPAQTTTSGWETDFGDTWCLTFWTGAAGWTSHFFFDYYQYTGDVEFLRTRAYPFMKEAALFYEDFLTIGTDGKYLFNPSYSPENNPGNSSSQAVLNATSDVMIAKQLLKNCIAAANVLKADAEKVKQWNKMLAAMPEYKINEQGVLKEWLPTELSENFKHRHASHLYSLYYGTDKEFEDETLKTAARKAIDERMKFRIAEGGGEMAFGLVQLASAATHLQDSENAHTLLKWLASNYWSTGFGSFHNVGELFNTDISGGLPYIVTQMLAQSEPGYVSLLPALPAEWEKGSITGMLLRGQLELKNLTWSPGATEVEMVSAIDQVIILKTPRTVSMITSSDKKAVSKTSGTLKVRLKANSPVTLSITY